VVLVLLGVHIAVALIGIGFAGIWLMREDVEMAMRLLYLSAYNGVADYIFATIPLFVLMGLLVSISNVGKDTFEVAEALLRRLRAMVTDPAARGLQDDIALLPTMGQQLVLTSDTMVEGVHFRADDPPETVGWKLAAVNLSDLAAKGAAPGGCLLNYTLAGDEAWDAAFLDGLGRALGRFGLHLIGGDTVALPPGAPRVLGLTAIGEVPAGQSVPTRSGARPGDLLYVSGPVGDAGAGLAMLAAGTAEPAELIRAYRVPVPHLTLGQSIAMLAHAMMDISDGLLIDARRMAAASAVTMRRASSPSRSRMRAD